MDVNTQFAQASDTLISDATEMSKKQTSNPILKEKYNAMYEMQIAALKAMNGTINYEELRGIITALRTNFTSQKRSSTTQKLDTRSKKVKKL